MRDYYPTFERLFSYRIYKEATTTIPRAQAVGPPMKLDRSQRLYWTRHILLSDLSVYEDSEVVLFESALTQPFTSISTDSIAEWPDFWNGRGIGWGIPFASIVRHRHIQKLTIFARIFRRPLQRSNEKAD